ncbi:unnamed protein product [Haemonchus placei]|uniref:PG_binding_1 domain-containing protein n=1 Tax=Haemonchus placei TaxID=6290 RepID=A0A158QRQ7_HAEPC|nr:unnamed protein product [Haemonchus placei]
MLGQESLLAVQFLAILLFDSPLSEACAPLPSGQEKIMEFQLSGFSLPEEMVYSTNGNAQGIASNMALTKERARKKIDGYIKQKMLSAMREQMADERLSKEDQSKVKKQIQFMQSTYDPLQCNDARSLTSETSKTVEFDSESSGNAYNCVVTQGEVIKVCKSTKCGERSEASSSDKTSIAKLQQIPGKFTTYDVKIKIRNARVANWDDSKWEQFLDQVKENLGKGRYSDQFGGATIETIESYYS